LRPSGWEGALDALAQRYGKMPDEIATRPWSVLLKWLGWADMLETGEAS